MERKEKTNDNPVSAAHVLVPVGTAEMRELAFARLHLLAVPLNGYCFSRDEANERGNEVWISLIVDERR